MASTRGNSLYLLIKNPFERMHRPSIYEEIRDVEPNQIVSLGLSANVMNLIARLFVCTLILFHFIYHVHYDKLLLQTKCINRTYYYFTALQFISTVLPTT